MRTIRAKLNFLLSIVALIFVALSFNAMKNFESATQADHEFDASLDLVKAMFELDGLATEYLLSGQARTYIEWQVRHEEIGRQINEVAEYVRPASTGRLRAIRENYVTLRVVFFELSLLRGKTPNAIRDTQILDNRNPALRAKLFETGNLIVNEVQQMADEDSEYARMERRVVARNMVFAGAVILLVLIVTGVLINHLIAKPLERLVLGTIEIGGGNLSYRTDLGRKDELGKLSVAMDIMAARLESSNQSRMETLRSLKAIGGRLIDAMETERSRIALDLHDDLGQQLALFSVEIDLLITNLPGSKEEIVQKLEALRVNAQSTTSAVHKISHELHPAILDQLGLIVAATSYCREVTSRSGGTIHFEGNADFSNLDAATSLCLYRVMQEAVQNVLKHSGSRKAWVKLYIRGKKVVLEVLDHGCGFDLLANDSHGLGMVSIQERLRLVHGHLDIESAEGVGTRVTASVEVNQA